MFFPASVNEKVYTLSELKSQNDVDLKLSYQKLPTVIICNPNALYYHHYVTYPNSYILNLLLDLNINVICWNYRGYGWTNGSVDPYNIKEDAE